MFIDMELKKLEESFNRLTEYTDQVALINTVYVAENISRVIDGMESYLQEIFRWDLSHFGPEVFKNYLSHMTFHREIVANIIADARELLMQGQDHIQDRRTYIKRLVSYHKKLVKWIAEVEKKNSVHSLRS